MYRSFDQDEDEMSDKEYIENFGKCIDDSKYFYEIARQEVEASSILIGREEGMIEGKKESKIEAAKNSLLLGFSIEIASKISGLSNKDVSKIAERLVFA